jgi:hypothetical protein
MALPNYVTKSFVMKPEVNKIFNDLEAWLDHCRMELIDFNPKDLYKSQEYRSWARWQDQGDRRPRRNPRNNIVR